MQLFEIPFFSLLAPRSRPYRFMVRNGGYIVLETDWSCFINPWSRKLEFVIGKHTVLKGPVSPNVFAAPANEDSERCTVSEGIMKEGKNVQVQTNKHSFCSQNVPGIPVLRQCLLNFRKLYLLMEIFLELK